MQTSCLHRHRVPECLRKALVVGTLIQPLHALNGCGSSAGVNATQSNGGGWEPRRCQLLRKAAVKEHITRYGVDVLDLVLNASADNRQCIDLRADISEPAGATLGDLSQGRVNF